MKSLLLLTTMVAFSVMPAAWAGSTSSRRSGPFFDVLPVTIEGRLMVPLRPLLEWLGARVEYGAGKVCAYTAGSNIPQLELWVGQNEARLAGRPYHLDVPPNIIKGRTLAPLRFVAESFGVSVAVKDRVVKLKYSQENLQAKMALAPRPESHRDKMWQAVQAYYNPRPGAEGYEVAGIRILSDTIDVADGVASARVASVCANGTVGLRELNFRLEHNRWKKLSVAVFIDHFSPSFSPSRYRPE